MGKKGSKRRALPRAFEMPWGKGEIVEEATACGEWHEPAVQLLRYENGNRSIRFCFYDHSGRFQRSPLLLGEELIPELRASLREMPGLRKLLKRLVT
jgi:hypothetical protein